MSKCNPQDDGDRLYLLGDYFGDEVHRKPAPTRVNFDADDASDFPLGRVIYWQLGEAVTAVCDGGLVIQSLTENPHPERTRFPGTFTLVATKNP